MLRTHIPSAAKHKKMSKVDTLRHAVEYIQSLNRMLNRNSTADSADDSETDDEEIQSQQQKNSLNQHDATSIQNNSPIGIKLETPLSPPPEPTLLVPHTSATSTSTTNIHGFTENYESGYETSSYYSSSCNSMISPVLPPSHPAHEHYNNPSLLYPNSDHNNQQYMELHPSQSRDYKYLPGTEVNHERNYNYQHNNLSIEPNSEEDELLDAIANWQDA